METEEPLQAPKRNRGKRNERRDAQVTIIGSPLFIDFGVPLLAVALSIFLKVVTRNDHLATFEREDLAFGLDLSITALLLFIVSSSGLVSRSIIPGAPQAVVEKAAAIPWILLSVFIGLWATSTVVRKLGWDTNGRLHVGWGIVVPDLFGVAVLLFVVRWIKP